MRWTKTLTPLRPPGFVERPKVNELLDDGARQADQGRVILVSAPAGQGKTAAVSEWVRRRPETTTVWVSLDATDRAEGQWWTTLLAALERPARSRARDGQERDEPSRWPADEGRTGELGLMAATLDLLEALPARITLVIDDVHEIVGHPAAAGLNELLRHPLPRVTLVLCSRYDPPISLQRLRVGGRLSEIRVADLSFTPLDAARLFANHSVHLSEEQVSILVERTEGWVAALRLAAMTMQELDDTGGFVDDFAGDDRSVADYLVGEVLTRLEPRQHTVLEVAAIGDPIPVELAVELSGHTDAAAVLDHLENLTALVTATDRRRTYFRTHQLLRSHLLARLRRRDPARLVDLYDRARRWHEEHGDHPRALHAAAAAGDVAAVRLVVRSRAVELIGRGEFDALARSDDVLAKAADDPRVRLVLGLTALERGDVDRGTALVDSAEAELVGHRAPEHQSGNLTVFRRVVATRVALTLGQLPRAIAVGATIDPDDADDAALRALALATRGTILLATDRHRGRADSAEALALAERHDWPYLAVQAQSSLAMSYNYAEACGPLQHHAHAVIDRASAHGWTSSPWTLRAWYALGTADVLGGRPHRALRHIERAEAASPAGHRQFDAVFATLRGAAEHGTGDALGGWRRIRHARVTHPDEHRETHELALAALLEHQAARALGRAREAAEVTRASSVRLRGSADLELMRAHDHRAVGDPRARAVIEPVLSGALRAMTSFVVVDAPLLDAEIALQRDELSLVRRRLARALELARRFDVRMPLRHISAGLRRHLVEHRGGFGDLEPVVGQILAQPAEAPVVEHYLTDRERDVLELLPTMRSVADIAHDLTVSPNTVKTHQRAIYRKLGVENRRHAVTRAREIGLLVTDAASHS